MGRRAPPVIYLEDSCSNSGAVVLSLRIRRAGAFAACVFVLFAGFAFADWSDLRKSLEHMPHTHVPFAKTAAGKHRSANRSRASATTKEGKNDMPVSGYGRAVICAALSASAFFGAGNAAKAQSLAATVQEGSPAEVQKKSSVAKAGDLSIHYDVYGDLASGTMPILVLHGAYMSADTMAPFIERLSRTRPVIVPDQRGHGRTGDVPGPITFESLADDAAVVLRAEHIERADIFGYSMGGSAAIQLAARHPNNVAKLVVVSAGSRFDTIYPEVIGGIAHITASTFDNTPIRQEYDRLAPRRQDFSLLVDKLKVLDATSYDWDNALRRLPHPTMVVMGDYDIVTPENAVQMFRMRGGGSSTLAAQGYLAEPPPARLLILPATSHIGIMADAEIVVPLVARFLDNETPRMPPGFF